MTAASLCPHSSDYVLGDFPRPGTELGLPQILVQLAGSRPYSGPGRDKAMTKSWKSYIVNDGEVAKPGQRREKPHP